MLSSNQRPLKPLNCKLLSYQSLNRHCLVHTHPSRYKCFVANSIPIYFYIIPVQGVALGVIISCSKLISPLKPLNRNHIPTYYLDLRPRPAPPPIPSAPQQSTQQRHRTLCNSAEGGKSIGPPSTNNNPGAGSAYGQCIWGCISKDFALLGSVRGAAGILSLKGIRVHT